MNISLIAKWIWRFKEEENSMWVNIIKSIHGEDGGMNELEVKKMHPCAWKSILLKLQKLKNANLNIPQLLQVKIGDGKDTRFWEDRWHDLGTFKAIFPRLYAL